MLKFDRGPILNEHFRLSAEIDHFVREHLHDQAGFAARKMVEIAESVIPELKRLSTTGIHTASGFIKGGNGVPGFHAGYDYLADKGYMNGQCTAQEAIELCDQAILQGWEWNWKPYISAIRDNERRLKIALAEIRRQPGVIQSELLRKRPVIGSETLYYAAKRGDICRVKTGRSYALSIPA